MLWTSINTFKEINLNKRGECTACGRKIERGETVLLKTCQDKEIRLETNKVILCNADCHAEYDQRFWESKYYDRLVDEVFEREMRIYDEATAAGYGLSAGIVSERLERELEEIIDSETAQVMQNFEI